MDAHYAEWLPGVRFTADLDGCGRQLAPVFAAALEGRRFRHCLEWCAGPAWIGLWLRHVGVCGELSVSDINPAALAAVERTDPAVPRYLSDALEGLPGVQFDLIVANPPNYCDIQRDHPHGHLRDDPRPSDPGWQAHRRFYGNVGRHLAPGGEIWISEVEPWRREVSIHGAVYDRRPREPIMEFADMIAGDGLHLVSVWPFVFGGLDCAILKVGRKEAH